MVSPTRCYIQGRLTIFVRSVLVGTSSQQNFNNLTMTSVTCDKQGCPTMKRVLVREQFGSSGLGRGREERLKGRNVDSVTTITQFVERRRVDSRNGGVGGSQIFLKLGNGGRLED